MLNSFVPAFEIDIMWAQRPIVAKHHRYTFYHPFVERLAHIISDLPAKIALSLTLHIPIYFMTNLRQTTGSFFIYWCFMLINLLTMAMLFRMIGSISTSREATVTPVSILTLLCVLYTGFVVPTPYMVPWFGWFRYINPVFYTYESVMINDLRNRHFFCSTTVPGGPSYSSVRSDGKLCSEVGRDSGTDRVSGTAYLALKYEYFEDHLWRNFGILVAMMVIFCGIHLLASEYIPPKKSRGEVLLFKTKQLPQPNGDEEKTIQASASFAQDLSLANNSGSHEPSQDGDPTMVAREDNNPSIFHWRGITYDVKAGRESRSLLRDINGWLKPGSLTVLMGATGAGKTTLLNVLAGRISSGVVGGNVFIDNKSRDATANFQRRMGYVQQNDIHLPSATVREALQFSALLRQSDKRSDKEKLAYVEKVLTMLDMEPYADALVGVPGEGLNVEQRKRLSIGVELVDRKSVV